MTIDYSKAQPLLIYDLIEEANPGFSLKYPPGSLTFGTPVAVTVNAQDPYQRDTEVLATPIASTGLKGTVKIRYRRIDLSVLFRDSFVHLSKYVVGTYPVADWHQEMADKYGLSLIAADFPSNHGALASGTTYNNLALNSTCLCFRGGYSVRWNIGKKPIDVALPENKVALVGRAWPGGNDFSVARKPQGEFLTYGVDLTSIKSVGVGLDGILAVDNIAANNNSALMLAIVDQLKLQTNRTNWSNAVGTIEGGLTALTWYRYAVPNVSIPEANSGSYNRCIAIQSKADSWFQGKILLHWNQ